MLYPKPVQKPRPPILIGGYVDAVLKRAATKGDGWLTYYYTAESFARVWAKVRGFAEEAGRNPDELISTNQLPICIGPRAKIEAPMKHWLQTEWDYASWSESTMDSAIMGTVEECVEQLEAAHRDRHRPHHLRSLQVREGAGRGRCPGNHPAAAKENGIAPERSSGARGTALPHACQLRPSPILDCDGVTNIGTRSPSRIGLWGRRLDWSHVSAKGDVA